MKNVTLSIIIVNFNTTELLKSCLTHLYASLKKSKSVENFEIIVIDNNSTDKSVEMIKNKFPSVIIIKNKQNVGFARANNQGIMKSSGAHILLLNTDARVLGNALEQSLRNFKEDTHIGVVGGKLMYEDQTLQSSVGFSPTFRRVFNWMFFIDDLPFLGKYLSPYHVESHSFYDKKHEVDWVTGAYLMIKREATQKAGLLDESLFMYGEEVEWCYRIKKKGYKIIFDPKIEVIHDKGGSSVSGHNAGIIEEFEFIRFFYKKYSGTLEQFIIKLMLKSGILLRLMIFGILSGYKERKHLYEKAFQLG